MRDGMSISDEIRQRLLAYEKNEITEHHIYRRLAKTIKSPENRRVLESIAGDEQRHYEQWRAYTQQDVAPDRWQIAKYFWISRVFGFTFGVKLMEMAEGKIQGDYGQLQGVIPEAQNIMQEEEQHEKALLGMLDEERLRYTGALILGLNDALVELTGAAQLVDTPASTGAPGWALWLTRVQTALHEASQRSPFVFYGADWLAFGHFAIALAFVGALCDPVRNRWLFTFGMIVCALVAPYAFVFGAIRGIPLWWRLIDCSFGVFGIIPVWLCRRWVSELESRLELS